jgi:hypothetical protein
MSDDEEAMGFGADSPYVLVLRFNTSAVTLLSCTILPCTF